MKRIILEGVLAQTPVGFHQKNKKKWIKGDWEFEYQFEAFAGLQSRRGTYISKHSKKESNGKVSVIVSDELNDDADPTEEQLNSINFITVFNKMLNLY